MFEKLILPCQKRCYFLQSKKNKSYLEVFEFKLKRKIYMKYLLIFFNAYIPAGVKIKGHIFFNHSFCNIFISEHATIGDGCSILQNTTIGSNQPFNNKAPVIGDNVYIGANCNIIGDVFIDDDCIIGAGTTIAKGHFKKGSVIVGTKCRVIEN